MIAVDPHPVLCVFLVAGRALDDADGARPLVPGIDPIPFNVFLSCDRNERGNPLLVDTAMGEERRNIFGKGFSFRIQNVINERHRTEWPENQQWACAFFWCS